MLHVELLVERDDLGDDVRVEAEQGVVEEAREVPGQLVVLLEAGAQARRQRLDVRDARVGRGVVARVVVLAGHVERRVHAGVEGPVVAPLDLRGHMAFVVVVVVVVLAVRRRRRAAPVLRALVVVVVALGLVVLDVRLCRSNLQLDFNVSIRDSFDAKLSAVLRELDESNRLVQKSAKSTSI